MRIKAICSFKIYKNGAVKKSLKQTKISFVGVFVSFSHKNGSCKKNQERFCYWCFVSSFRFRVEKFCAQMRKNLNKHIYSTVYRPSGNAVVSGKRSVIQVPFSGSLSSEISAW